MKLYIAGPWLRRPDVIKAAEKFKKAGFEITSRWFNHQGDPLDSLGNSLDKGEVYRQACEDLQDIDEADFLVVLNLEKSEGKAVETGYAIATGTPFLTVGDRKNIFAVLGAAELDSVEEAIAFLNDLYGQTN